jgi:hypothetical protein
MQIQVLFNSKHSKSLYSHINLIVRGKDVYKAFKKAQNNLSKVYGLSYKKSFLTSYQVIGYY